MSTSNKKKVFNVCAYDKHFSCSHFIATLVQHYDTNEPIFPAFFIQNEMRNKITVNDLMSARGALKIFHNFYRALIGEGHLLEMGAYFKILKNRNPDF